MLVLLVAPDPDLSALRLPPACAQVVRVTSRSWTATEGTATLFAKDGGTWTPAGAPFPVCLGRSGMGWGLGAVAVDHDGGPEKVEGDGRSPAGVFDLPFAFGRDAALRKGAAYPYRRADERDYWVDDPTSEDYNTCQRIADGPNDPKARWKSWERMLVSDYDLALVVAHNTTPVVRGRGSAIFLHLWWKPTETTAGCTSMARPSMERLLSWLDPMKRPMLVQMPENALRRATSTRQLSSSARRTSRPTHNESWPRPFQPDSRTS